MSRLRTGAVVALFVGFTTLVAVAQPPVPPKDPPAKDAPPAPPPAAKDAPPPAKDAPAAKDAPPTPPPAAPADKDKTTFAPKLEKGKPFYQEMTTSVVQQIKVQGQDLTQKQEQTFYFEWTPEKQDGDKWTLKEKVIGVKMKIDISGNPIEYDSTNKNAATAGSNPGLTDFFKNLEGAEFTVVLGKDYKVENVVGKDDFVKKLSAGNTQLETLLKKILTDDALKQMSDPSLGVIPAKPVGVKDTWESKSSLNLGPIGSYDVVYKYTYTGKDPDAKDDERVEVVPTLTYKAPTDNTDGLLFRIKGGDLKSTGSKPGFIRYNAKTGYITESSIPIELKGTLTVTIGGADTSVELSQTQTTTVKTTEKSPLEKK